MQCPQLRLIRETWDGAETPRIRLFQLKVFEKEDARPFLSLKLKNDKSDNFFINGVKRHDTFLRGERKRWWRRRRRREHNG